MAQVALNADIYAQERLNQFFKTVAPSLEGQCVTLTKCFMQDMSEVPNPHAARGDARYVGKKLVSEGHAVEVPYAERKRGDLICYEYGTYGHIGVVLSNDRTFEENINWPGVPSKVVAGSTVYASRIGQLSEAWRHNQHVYRLKTYKEGEEVMNPTVAEVNSYFRTWKGRSPTTAELANHIKKPWSFLADVLLLDQKAKLKATNSLVIELKRALENAEGEAILLAPGRYQVN